MSRENRKNVYLRLRTHVSLGLYCDCGLCCSRENLKPTRLSKKAKILKSGSSNVIEKPAPSHEMKESSLEVEKPNGTNVPGDLVCGALRRHATREQTKVTQHSWAPSEQNFGHRCPNFISLSIQKDIVNYVNTKNVIFIVGPSRSGKTQLVNFVAEKTKRSIVHVHDLDYDVEVASDNIACRQILNYPFTTKDKIISIELLDVLPQSMIKAILKVLQSTKRVKSPLVVIAENSTNSVVKSVLNKITKGKAKSQPFSGIIRLYNTALNKGTKDTHLTETLACQHILGMKSVIDKPIFFISDAPFLQRLTHNSYLKRLHPRKIDLALEGASFFSDLDSFGWNSSLFSTDDTVQLLTLGMSNIKKQPIYGSRFPNFKFPSTQKTKSSSGSLLNLLMR